MTVISIMYPQSDKSTFDMDYFLKSHMPLVEEKWTPFGMTHWNVAKLAESGPYSVHTSLYFKSKEEWDKALQGPEGVLLLADVPNYSSETPIILVGEVVKKG